MAVFRVLLVSLVRSFLFLLSPRAADQRRSIVAMFGIEKGARIDLPREARDGLVGYIASRLTESGKFQVIPRDQLKNRLFTQKQKSYKECYDQAC